MTRDFGSERLLEATVEDPTPSETVVRFLDREAEVETRYGGNFVASIDGLAGGGARDWFFYLNGYWSPVGAGEARVQPGDRVWWDLREWSDVYRVPAVVGSWPEPFVHGFDGERFAVGVGCLDGGDACRTVTERLREVGAEVEAEPGRGPGDAEGERLRVLVGPWERVRDDDAAGLIEGGPAESGVFARFERVAGGWRLLLLDPGGEPVEELAAGAGLIAATQLGDRQPTWVVTGTDRSGVEHAAERLEEDSLADRYAVALRGDDVLPLPRETKGQ